MSIEFPRFRDITEYSTNAIINQRKSYRHPALRESALATPFTAHRRYLLQRYEKVMEKRLYYWKIFKKNAIIRKRIREKESEVGTYQPPLTPPFSHLKVWASKARSQGGERYERAKLVAKEGKKIVGPEPQMQRHIGKGTISLLKQITLHHFVVIRESNGRSSWPWLRCCVLALIE